MAIYAIGDVQGCFNELQQLLQKIEFNPKHDQLWFTGDLVNRGNQSLETLRFVKSLGKSAITVLGNHDLHFLAVAVDAQPLKTKDTFHDLLATSDLEDIINWFRHLPLIHHDSSVGYTIVHAGIAPQWTLQQALSYAKEVEDVLRSKQYRALLQNMYGNSPLQWQPQLDGWQRLRLIINYFTRMRYVDASGSLELIYKGPLGGQPQGYYPWFKVPQRAHAAENIIFGHWASLQGKASTPHIYAIDTGCCWGNCLTALRLNDKKRFSVACDGRARIGIQDDSA